MNWNGDKSIKMNLDKTGKSDKTGTTNKDIKYDDILLNGNAGTTNKNSGIKPNVKYNDILSKLDKYKDKIKALSTSVEEYENTINKINSNLYKSNKDNEDKTLTINNQLEQIKILNEIVAEYKEFKDTNKVLAHSNKELTKNNNDLVHENLDLKDKISNVKDMNKFYKEQILKLEEEVRKLNAENNNNKDKYEKEIELLKNTQNKKIDDIKLENKMKLEEKEKDFENRLEFEKEKIQLEVEKINSKYKLLEIKYNELK